MSAGPRVILTLTAAACALALALTGCQGAQLRGRIAGLSDVADKAEKAGARRCAPRELALARAHLRFAETELDQGQYSDAVAQVEIAEPNAHASLANTNAEKCTDQAAPKPIPRPGDKDGDGIVDTLDKCPNAPETYNGVDDTDGCPDDPDSDNDGIADSVDQCVMIAEDKDGYLDEDGCPDPDNDADGIADGADKCPKEPEDFDGFQDDDGCPDKDNDSDTVADVDDMCPNTPGSPTGPKPGCPSLIVVTAKEIRITQQIQFEFNKAVIKGDISFKILDEIVAVLKANPKISLEVQGHTDNVGNPPYNQKLSQQRADSVRAYLVAHGIEPGRLIAKGYGQSKPLVPNNSEANKALNRRVQFIRSEAPASTP